MSVYWVNNGTNLTVNAIATNTVKATVGRTTGKYYWEIYVNIVNATLIGIADSSVPLTGNNFTNTSCRWYYYLGEKTPPRNNYGSSFTTGDTIGVFLDLDNKILEFFKNGVSQGVAFTNLSSLGEVYPAISGGASNRQQTVTANFGASDFTYIPTNLPSGTLSYDGSQNLKVVNKTLILHDGEYKKYVKNSLVDNSNVSIVPIMTSDTSPAPFKITASAYNASDFPYKAFNNVLDTTNRNYWYSGSTGSNHWLKVDTGEIDKYIVNKYSINSFSTYRPTGWILEGSNNDSEWTKLDERTSQSYSDNTDAFYEFSNEIAYRYYRITVKTTNSTNTSVVTPIINKFNLFGKIALEVNNWLTVSSILPISTQFLAEGMDSLSPLLDRRVEILEPLPMTEDSTQMESGKLFSKTIDLNKYIDIRSINVEVE